MAGPGTPVPAGGVEGAGVAAGGEAVSAPASPAVAGAVHWTRASAEHDALLVQIYRWAGERVAVSVSGRARGTWAVIMDADETVLDNSTYQRERLEAGAGYTSASWNEWVRRRSATVLPGAAGFIAQVREMGGRVAIVTNRDEVVCADTRENFATLGIEVDVVLCRQAGQSNKNPRFARVREGGAASGFPPLDVVMWVGDNIQDFPSMTQALRLQPATAFGEFGARFVILPNPMYGSWESNPPR
jgi:5'-nucleotidase (lipoprotein e(P4) family)